jgi:hypothetical protein
VFAFQIVRALCVFNSDYTQKYYTQKSQHAFQLMYGIEQVTLDYKYFRMCALRCLLSLGEKLMSFSRLVQNRSKNFMVLDDSFCPWDYVIVIKVNRNMERRYITEIFADRPDLEPLSKMYSLQNNTPDMMNPYFSDKVCENVAEALSVMINRYSDSVVNGLACKCCGCWEAIERALGECLPTQCSSYFLSKHGPDTIIYVPLVRLDSIITRIENVASNPVAYMVVKDDSTVGQEGFVLRTETIQKLTCALLTRLRYDVSFGEMEYFGILYKYVNTCSVVFGHAG